MPVIPWEEELHPRGGKGSPTGGQFVSKGGGPRPRLSLQRRMGAVDIYEAIDNYVNLSHYFVNSYLREGNRTVPAGSPNEQDCKRIIDAMDAGFADKTIAKTAAKPITVYRGIESVELFKQLKKAKGFSDPGFISTSTVETIAGYAADSGQDNADIMMVITVPKGARYLTGRRDEKEIILNRDSSFKITGKQEEGSTLRVHATLVEPKAKLSTSRSEPDKKSDRKKIGSIELIEGGYDAYKKRVQGLVDDVTKKMEFDPSRVKIEPGMHPEGGLTEGAADPNTGMVTMYPLVFALMNRDDNYIKGSIAHEVFHLKFFELYKAMEERFWQMTEDPKLKPYFNPKKGLSIPDELEGYADEKYPAGYRLDPKRIKKMLKSGYRISDYAAEWADKGLAKGADQMTMIQAENECLAEVARTEMISNQAQMDRIPAEWRKYYYDLLVAHAKLKKGKA